MKKVPRILQIIFRIKKVSSLPGGENPVASRTVVAAVKSIDMEYVIVVTTIANKVPFGIDLDGSLRSPDILAPKEKCYLFFSLNIYLP
jgi:hypothetical protein